MTSPRDPDRLIDAFLGVGPDSCPIGPIDAVRDDIDHTRQRVVIGPWREPNRRISRASRSPRPPSRPSHSARASPCPARPARPGPGPGPSRPSPISSASRSAPGAVTVPTASTSSRSTAVPAAARDHGRRRVLDALGRRRPGRQGLVQGSADPPMAARAVRGTSINAERTLCASAPGPAARSDGRRPGRRPGQPRPSRASTEDPPVSRSMGTADATSDSHWPASATASSRPWRTDGWRSRGPSTATVDRVWPRRRRGPRSSSTRSLSPRRRPPTARRSRRSWNRTQIRPN